MYKFLVILLLLFAELANAQDNKIMSDSDISNWVKNYMANAVKFDKFNGVVVVAHNGNAIFKRAYGLANRELNVANTLTTKFRIGSVSKTFTAAAIALLYQEKKIALDSSILKYLTDVPLSWKAITIRHLLSHTSGLVNYTTLPEARGDFLLIPHTHKQTIDIFVDKPLESKPGEKYNYNNSGYYLLAMIVEKVSGLSLGDYLNQRIFKALRMKDTGLDRSDTILAKRASAYRIINENLTTNTFYISMENALGIGGHYSTAIDLLKWDQAFYSNKLFNNQTLKEIFTRGKNTNYGLGWIVDSIGNFSRSYHDGGITDFSTSLQRITGKNLTIIAISNQGSDAGIKVAYDIAGKICSYPATVRGIQPEMAKLTGNQLFVLIKKIKTGFPRFRINEKLVEEIALDLTKQKKGKQSVELYKLNTLLYPDSDNAFLALGEAYLAVGNLNDAKKNFRKCLALNADNKRALTQMSRLN